MASSIKVGSAWKQITGLSTKVGGSWKTVSAAYTKVGGVWKQWYAPVVVDNFNRSTSGGLGTTTSGASWAPLRDVWYANGSSAQCDSAATGYPLAKVGFGNVKFTASAGVSNGTGLAFWIQDKDNWYAAYAFQTTTSTSVYCGQTSCAPCSTSSSTYTPSTSNSCTCNSGDTGGGYATQPTAGTPTCEQHCPTTSCNYYGPINLFSEYCAAGYTQAKTLPANCGGATAGNNSAYCYKIVDDWYLASPCYGGICCCGSSVVGSPTVIGASAGTCNDCTHSVITCNSCAVYCPSTSTSWALRLIKMTAGNITIAATDVALSGTPAAIRVSTESGNIEVFAYSDAAMTNQMGATLSHTPATQGPGTAIGLIKSPSDSQGSTVDNLVVTL